MITENLPLSSLNYVTKYHSYWEIMVQCSNSFSLILGCPWPEGILDFSVIFVNQVAKLA